MRTIGSAGVRRNVRGSVRGDLLGLVRVLAWLVSLHTCQAARAQAPQVVQVERGHGAEQCPDAAALSSHIDAIRGLSPTAARNPYHVEFTHENGGYSAAIRPADSAQVARVLNAPGESCAALAQATAVTLALILDALAEPPAAEPPPEAAAAQVVTAPAESAPSREVPLASPLRLHASAGVGAVLGITRDVSPAVLAELALEHGAFHGGLGMLWAPASRQSLGPGSLRSQLWSGAVRGCYRALGASSWQLAACSGIMVGAIEVSARGFTRNEQRSRLWLAIPLELALTYLPGPVGVQAGLGALFPIKREDFSVDGLGAAYDSWPVAALFSLQVAGGWPQTVLRPGAKN